MVQMCKPSGSGRTCGVKTSEAGDMGVGGGGGGECLVGVRGGLGGGGSVKQVMELARW